MKLSMQQRAVLAGKGGAGAAKAMEILSALGVIEGAPDMVEVGSAQVSGISYKNIGEHGLSFLEDWAAMGSKAVVPAFMNPGGADRRLWKSLGFPAAFVAKQERVIAALERLGVRPTLTCTPYHAGCVPRLGEHVAWAESSAVCYANSVLGARTNREGGPSALAAALTGVTPRHTLHTDEGRRPTRLVSVRCPVETGADAGALGNVIGRLAASDPGGGIPYITGVEPPPEPARTAWLKALGAGMAASGSTGLYHIEHITPEAKALGQKLLSKAKKRSEIRSLDEGYERLRTGKGKIDLVALGCPHASLEELKNIKDILRGRKVRLPTWIFASEAVRQAAAGADLAKELKKTGVSLLADTCMVVAPMKEMGIRTIATDSGKAAHYMPSHHGIGVYFGSTEECLEAAVRGRWERP